ncbi:RNA polymerase sigma factor [Streptomyces sp. NPDC090054]|uniref:RNA polymerase sigma factor n=1 Tax=Streptomyces sp. NPDC090054 TaxID=3365933 RepID=UPI0037F796D0
MASESVPNPRIPAQKQRFFGLLGIGKSPVRTVDEQLEEIARSSRIYTPTIARRLGQPHHSPAVEDVFQDALAKLTKRLKEEGGPPVGNIHAYMRAICFTCAMDELRRVKARAEVLLGDNTTALDARENVLLDDSGVYYADIRAELGTLLSELEHKALYYTAVQDFTAERTGELMDISTSSVSKALRRARTKIARYRPDLGQDS